MTGNASPYGLFDDNQADKLVSMNLNDMFAVFVHCEFDEVARRCIWMQKTFPQLTSIVVWKFFKQRLAVRNRALNGNIMARPSGSFLLLGVNWDVQAQTDIACNTTAFEIETTAKQVDRVAVDVASTFFSLTNRLLVTQQCRRTGDYDILVVPPDYSHVKFLRHKAFTPISAPPRKKFQAFLEHVTLENLVAAKPQLDLLWNPKHQSDADLNKRMQIWKKYVPFLPSPEDTELYDLAKSEQWLRRLQFRIKQLRRQKQKVSPVTKKKPAKPKSDDQEPKKKEKGFAAPMPISPELRAFIEKHFTDEILDTHLFRWTENGSDEPQQQTFALFRRTVFQQLLANYIKRNDLQNPQNKVMVMIENDPDLNALLKPSKSEVNYMEIPALINPHFLSNRVKC
jgi:hypothetical protein